MKHKITDVTVQLLNDCIKNLEPAFAEKLLHEFQKYHVKDYVVVSDIKSAWYRLSNHPGKSFSRNSINYWILRGWSEEIALRKKHESQKLIPNKSPYSVKSYVGLVNPATQLEYTQSEIEYQIKSKRSINKEYWIERGHSEQDAIEKVSEVQRRLSQKSVEKYRAGEHIRFDVSVEYWTSRGFSEEDAKKKLALRQDTLSISSRVHKYGLRKGILKYLLFIRETAKRVAKDRYAENKSARIHSETKRKAILTVYLKAKSQSYSPQEIQHMIDDEYRRLIKLQKGGHASMESLLFFKPVYHMLKHHQIEVNVGYDGLKEFKIYHTPKRFYRYDFCIPQLKLIFEYDGVNYHGNVEQKEKDEVKMSIAQKEGFTVVRLDAAAPAEELCNTILVELHRRGVETDRKFFNTRFYRRLADSDFENQFTKRTECDIISL